MCSPLEGEDVVLLPAWLGTAKVSDSVKGGGFYVFVFLEDPRVTQRAHGAGKDGNGKHVACGCVPSEGLSLGRTIKG